jgi:hypothetical protein
MLWIPFFWDITLRLWVTGSDWPLTRRRTPDETTPVLHRYKNPKIRKAYAIINLGMDIFCNLDHEFSYGE